MTRSSSSASGAGSATAPRRDMGNSLIPEIVPEFHRLDGLVSGEMTWCATTDVSLVKGDRITLNLRMSEPVFYAWLTKMLSLVSEKY